MPASKSDATQLGAFFQSELSKIFSNFTPSQRRLLSEMMGLSKIKLPVFPNSRTGLDHIGLMGASQVTLAKHGWFISLTSTPTVTSFSAASCFLSGSLDKGNQMMAEHYRDVLGEIQKEAQASFPLRSIVLKKAFDAHRRKEYEISVPVILIQTDGIGEDIFGNDVSPTSRRPENIEKRKKIVESKFGSATDRVFGDYFSLISSLLPINAGKSERVKFNSPLNRHLVLHGIDTNYATEINALKAASWLQHAVSLK